MEKETENQELMEVEEVEEVEKFMNDFLHDLEILKELNQICDQETAEYDLLAEELVEHEASSLYISEQILTEADIALTELEKEV